MKISPQVYVRGSIEAAKMYCKAFGAEISFQIKDENIVRNAYDILREGGTVIDPLGPCPWSSFCSNLIDKFGVVWWISI